MKYKVLILMQESSGVTRYDGATALSFYTKSQAIAYCQAVAEVLINADAYLWDGQTLTLYS